MSNKYRQHVVVLPEDDANRQVVNGFVSSPGIIPGRIKVLRSEGGWMKVVESFREDGGRHNYLRNHKDGVFILVIDFDGDEDRLHWALDRIPADVRDRVFIVGARTDPEDLKRSLRQLMACGGSYEEIGRALAEDCRAGTRDVWDQPDLACNRSELDRMAATVRPCLFGVGL